MSAALEKVDEPEQGSPDTTPLVLIHDGSGTVFHYYMLGPLNRTLYAIAYPYFDSQSMPAGGLHQLATEYVAAIRETVGKGPIIVGGSRLLSQSYHGMLTLYRVVFWWQYSAGDI
jgi:hypothetical protein